MSKFIDSAQPSIALHPSQLPQQKLTVVRGVPELPADWQFTHAEWGDKFEEDFSTTEYLCALEWAWSPMHNRLQSWKISKSRCANYFLLSTGFFNDEALLGPCDEDGEPLDEDLEPWTFYEVGYCKTYPNLSFKDHAVLCLIESLREEVEVSEIDEYHWVNSADYFDCSDIAAIARVVWPEPEEDKEEGGDE